MPCEPRWASSLFDLPADLGDDLGTKQRNALEEGGVRGLATLVLSDDLLDPAHFAGLQSDLDAVRVVGGLRQDVFNHATGQPPGSLV